MRWKCQYGCPPDSPTPEETKTVVASYQRAILFHIEMNKEVQEKGNYVELYADIFKELVTLEGDMFKDGYYKAFLMLAGPCHLCRDCAKLSGEPCKFLKNARPSMETFGIDVYQTARNNGFFVKTLSEKGETQNYFYLMSVD